MPGRFGKSTTEVPFADPTELARFGKLEVVARLVVEGFIMGQHKKAASKDDLANILHPHASGGTSALMGSSKGVLMADGADLEMPIDDPS